MTFNGVSGSDKAPLRFIYMQSGILVAIWLLSFFTEVSSEVVAPLEQGFFFDWTPGGARLPTPITAQCESINIKWGRGNATGRTPIAPFSLAIYLSTATVPVVVPAPGNPVFELDLPIPFEPLTQYQICMYDTNGVSGGCQSTYTVYPSPNATSVGSSHCPNITIPAKSLDVVASTVADGPLSPFGWINQCSDISFTPTSGTPPYTLTIAPSSRPPFNVTLNDRETYNWTLSLGYGTQFFVSMVDSKGLGWVNGPLHSGLYGSTDCLSALGASSGHTKSINPAVAVGTAIGGLGFGLLLGLLVPLCITRWKGKEVSPTPPRDPKRQASGSSTAPMLTDAERGQAQQSGAGRVQNRIFGGRGSQYGITPFPPDAGSTRSRRSTLECDSIYETLNANGSTLSFARAGSPRASVISIGRPQSPLSLHSIHARSFSESAGSPVLAAVPSPPYSRNSTPIPGDLSSFELNQSLLLLHHDGGPIMLNDGTNVYESPPGYGEVQAQDRARSPPPARLEPQRRPGHKRAQTSNI